MTAFDKQQELIHLFEDFGFSQHRRTHNEELVLVKTLRPSAEDDKLSALELHVQRGPPTMRFVEPAYIIPIEPRFHHLLFPDVDEQLALDAGSNPFGNGLRKAYLCRSPIRQIPPGAPLLFYLSETKKAVTVVGVAEETFRSQSAEQITSRVGKRTVYSMRDIEQLCEQGEVLAILFRQAFPVATGPVSRAELMQNQVLKDSPQSIVTVPGSAHAWLRQRLAP